jgi:hypothetical protein
MATANKLREGVTKRSTDFTDYADLRPVPPSKSVKSVDTLS